MAYNAGDRYTDPYTKMVYTYLGNDYWTHQTKGGTLGATSFQLGLPLASSAGSPSNGVPTGATPTPTPNPVPQNSAVPAVPPLPAPLPGPTPLPTATAAPLRTSTQGGFRSGRRTPESTNQYIQKMSSDLGVDSARIAQAYNEWFANPNLGNSASSLDDYIRRQTQSQDPLAQTGASAPSPSGFRAGRRTPESTQKYIQSMSQQLGVSPSLVQEAYSQWFADPSLGNSQAALDGFIRFKTGLNRTTSSSANTGTQSNTAEALIAPQRDDNPLSNALALARAVSAEVGPMNISAEDLRREMSALGFDQFLNTEVQKKEALRLNQEEADRAYQKADEQLRNRYGGLGISGLQKQRAYDLAQEYALQKAKMGVALQKDFEDSGMNRQLALMDRASQLLSRNQAIREDRFSQLLSAGLRQNEFQAGVVQRERDRDTELQSLMARLNHDVGMREWENNSQSKAALQSSLYELLLPLIFQGQNQGMGLTSGVAADVGVPGGTGTASSPFNPLQNLLGDSSGLDLNSLLPLLSLYGVMK